MKYAIGIDIGGTKIAAGIVNENGELIQKKLCQVIPYMKKECFHR